jgi:hypothetical protein
MAVCTRFASGQAPVAVASIERVHALAEAGAALQTSSMAADACGLRSASARIAALTAAFVLTGEARYAKAARTTLDAWLALPDVPWFLAAQDAGGIARRDTVVALVPYAEMARAACFLTRMYGDEFDAVAKRFAELLALVLKTPGAQLARDSMNHDASAWLLLTSALARITRDDKQLDQNRLLFRKTTLRSQIDALGRFPQEAPSDNPLRNTLFNFDLLGGAAQLLTTPFDDPWKYELADGPGLRSVAANLYPLLRDPALWPYPADAAHFHEVPRRRPALLFAGRAYQRPEYVALFSSLPVQTPPVDIAYSVPIRQPLLWTARAPHGL